MEKKENDHYVQIPQLTISESDVAMKRVFTEYYEVYLFLQDVCNRYG